MRFLTSVGRYLVFTNLYVVIIIGFLLWQTVLLVDSVSFWQNEKVLFVLSASLFLYPLHRLLGALKLPEELKQERHKYTERNKKILFVVIVLSGLVCVYFAFTFSLSDWLVLSPLVLISLAYVNPLRYFKHKLPALRDFLYFKTASVALVVSLITVVFPFYESMEIGELTAYSISRFLFVYALTLPFDARDSWLDKKMGVHTLATELGKDKVIKLALFVNVLFALCVFVQYFFLAHISLLVFVVFILSELLANVIIRKSATDENDLWYAFAIEGMFVYQTLLLAIVLYFLS